MNFNSLKLSFWSSHRLPVILQTEAAECGLACLAMIAGYWGHQIDMQGLRAKFSVSLKGTNLLSIVSMAERMALPSRALRIELEHLPNLQLPCILHWNMNHFVVLKKVLPNAVIIHDPAIGERKIPIDDFSRQFTGVALELTPSSQFEKKNEVTSFSFMSLLGHVNGLKRGLLNIFILGICLQVCALVAPFYMQWLVDEALLSADISLITVLGIGFLLLVVLQTAIGSVRSWVTTVLSTNFKFQWLSNAFSHLVKLPLGYFEKRHTGDVVSRFGSIHTIQHTITTQFVEAAIDGLLVVSTFVMMLIYSPILAAVACFAVALYFGLRWLMFNSIQEATTGQIIHAARQHTHFMETVRGMQSIRLFRKENERRSSWLNAIADQFNAELKISKLSLSYITANQLLFGAERVIVIWLAALAVLNREFSVGMLFAFISYKDQFSQRMASLVDKVYELKMLRLHGERLADILLTEPEDDQGGQEIDTSQLETSIEFRNVSFRYSEGEPWVIQNLNLLIPAGQCVAIAGPSGCGKTTLFKLLTGLLEPIEGEILVGGHPLRILGQRNFRGMIATVMQDDQLFAGSIADNISFFDTQPNLERIHTCAQLAAIHYDIMQMPMTYNTLIGDIGTGLSGGQKQRVLLARALYQKPRILLLDEATSHLDVWNEALVNRAISSIPMTRVLVAHRPETIASAERVVELKHGAIDRDVMNSKEEEFT